MNSTTDTKLLASPIGNNEVPRADQLTSMESPKRIGLTIFFLVFGLFGVWAAVAPLDGAAQAVGTVTVRSYKKVIQHLEGGIVSNILVQDGDHVAAGDPLLVMDDTQPLAQLEIINGRFMATKAREARFIAERDQLDAIIVPQELDENEPAVRAELDAQREIFAARKESRLGETEVLEQRIQQLQSQLVGLRGLKNSKEQLAISFNEELDDVSELLSLKFSTRDRLRELERNRSRLEGEAAELTASIASTEMQIGETRLQILQLNREFRNEVVQSLSETQTSLKDIRERRNALQDVVSRTVVRAPVGGIVNGMQFHTIGGVIGPGTQIAEIVPQSDELIVDARVSPIDIDRVAIGQEATVRFSTFGSSVPTITGEVLSLSADSFQDEATGMSYYRARVEVTEEGMEELGDLTLLPGMPAEVFIATGSRTLLQYLFKPFSNAIARSFNED
ncbi:MAG: HlyD family type I secretion periplasmic adaptor subunit [Gammaproteobacteria bacterium]